MAEIEITRVSELDALEAVADEDLLAIVDDPSGASQTKKITREDFLGSAPIVATSGVTGDLTGNVTGDVTGNADTASACTGNAATAAALQTARNIGGTSFNGTADIDPATSVNHSGTYAHDQAVATTSSPTFAAVTSGGSALKWKVFTGTTSASGVTEIAHGLTSTNIVGASVNVAQIIGPNVYDEVVAVNGTKEEIYFNFGALNMYIYNSVPLRGLVYKLVIFYT